MVTLWLNTTRAPLNDAKVRLAISAGIDRQQLSTQGETDYEPPATSSGGLLLPIDSPLVDQSVSNDLKPTSDAAKASQILTSDGWKKVGGKWTKNGKTIKFAIEDPSAFTDYATDAQLIATQLNGQGFNVTFNGVEATKWFADYPTGNFDAMIHWSNQGPNPYYYFQNWIDNTQSAPIGKPAAGDYGRFNDPAAQAALAEFAGSNSSATQQDALNKLQQIVSTQAPVIPLLYGAAWYEYSTKNYTGWPTASQPVQQPGSERPLHPGHGPASQAGWLSPAVMPTPFQGRTPPGRVSGRAGAQIATPADDAELIASLSLNDKVLLLTGADSWSTQGADAIGLHPMILSDGPCGARGVALDERHPSTSLPSPSAMGATWDPDLVSELAAALGEEASSKGIHVLLGPTINLMRTPLGGRGFECFAEDPVLTAQIAVGYVRGLQQAGVAATIKHYVANDSETERWSYDAQIAEYVLRELYLPPFEACVRDANVALVMAAYNKVNGVPMTENARLLAGVLKREWGFAGVVTSDWHAARSTTATALATLDLAMPGPDGPWGEQLANAVSDGVVTEQILDDKLMRLLALARRVGALGDSSGLPSNPRASPA